ncbi:hypothetical protein ACFY4C_21005 [Actinomadura viridis]|uniref:hypothetical protein n=1 Tax=Actinomadura viridis TaxID=58110 RepID=UPI0036C0769F
MADSNRVIDLRTRSTYTPDCATLARNRLALARQSLGLTTAEFADILTPMVGWPVTADAVEAWESSLVPPGDVVVAASAVTPTSSGRAGVRSHKFIAAYIGAEAATKLGAGAEPVSGWLKRTTIAAEHPSGACELHLLPFGVAIYHLVEDLEVATIASLAVWRYRSYRENLAWATTNLRQLTGDANITASYVLSAYWLHTPIWAGRMLDTAVRIISSPRVLVDRGQECSDTVLATAEQAERELLAEGFAPREMQAFGVDGVATGYSSWSGVAYHPLDPARSLSEDELVECELSIQSMWAYCEYLNHQVEQGHAPVASPGYGWRFLRAARSRLANPRPQETGQHCAMRDAILHTSGLLGHLDQAIEALREDSQ